METKTREAAASADAAVQDASAKQKRRRGRRGSLLLLLLGIVLGLGTGYGLDRLFVGPEVTAAPVITSDTIVEQIRHVQELVTTEYHYKNIGELKDQKDFRGIPLPFTERRILYTFKGTIKAGVNVGKIDVTVDDEAKTVTLSIPQGEIIAHEMPPGDVQPYEESVSFFSSFTMDDYARLLADRKAVIEQEFLAEDYLADAQREAGRVLETLLSSLPGMGEYTLNLVYGT